MVVGATKGILCVSAAAGRVPNGSAEWDEENKSAAADFTFTASQWIAAVVEADSFSSRAEKVVGAKGILFFSAVSAAGGAPNGSAEWDEMNKSAAADFTFTASQLIIVAGGNEFGSSSSNITS
jgi:hypothetical protein